MIPSMSLATRCPKCNTVFQVNEEQLKRYSGVVRCGVCHNPFNGIDHLIGRLSHSEPDSALSKPENVSSALISRDSAPTKPGEQGKAPAKETFSSNLAPSSEKINEDDENTAINETISAQEAALRQSFEKQIQSISFDLNLSSPEEDKPDSSVTDTTNPTAGDTEAKPAESIPFTANIERKEPFLPDRPRQRRYRTGCHCRCA